MSCKTWIKSALLVSALSMALLAPVTASLPPAPSVQPAISTSAYSQNYVLGGVEQFDFPNGGTIQSVASTFNSGSYVGGVDWQLFVSNPTGGGTTDHAAMAITPTDMPKLKAVIHASDCKLVGSVTSICQSGNSPQTIRLAAGTKLFVVKQILAGATFSNATDDTDTINVLPL